MYAHTYSQMRENIKLLSSPTAEFIGLSSGSLPLIWMTNLTSVSICIRTQTSIDSLCHIHKPTYGAINMDAAN